MLYGIRKIDGFIMYACDHHNYIHQERILDITEHECTHVDQNKPGEFLPVDRGISAGQLRLVFRGSDLGFGG